ncbi:MAG: Calx-beta domain-containing protein, partial [Methylomonas sp.]
MTPFTANAWTLDFTPAAYTVNEAAGTAQVNVTVTQQANDYGGLEGPCTISGAVASTGGTATAGSDYNIPNGAFSFSIPSVFGQSPPFTNTFTVPVNIIDDTLVEGTETINLAIQNVVSNCGFPDPVSTGGGATISITDNDTPAPPPPPPHPPNPTPNLTLDPNFT